MRCMQSCSARRGRAPGIGALVAMLVLLASGCGQQAKLPPLAAGSVVLAFGDSLKADQMHPNAQGYRLMAQRVYDLLKKAGAL